MAVGSVGDRLERAREALFVGRADELAAVERLLAPDGQLRFLYLAGPGGIGKTELLNAAARRAVGAGRSVTRIDGRDRSWSAEDLGAALLSASTSGPTLILLDTFEVVATLEASLRTEILPRLPDHVRVLAAGRVRLSTAWREDPGWWSIAHEMEVGPLSASECHELLVRRGIDDERATHHASLLPAHPLSLALVADILRRDPDASVATGGPGSMVQTLADRLLAGLDDEARVLLETAALLPCTTPQSLACALDVEDARFAFDWLRRWSFISPHRDGLLVHDIVRKAVDADLTGRDPLRRATVLRRVANHLLARWPANGATRTVETATVVDGCRVLFHMLPALAQSRDDMYVVPARPEVWPALDAMVSRHEGPASLAALRFWRTEGADVLICRTDDSELLGFLSVLQLDRVNEAQAARDPGTMPLWRAWRDAGLFEDGRAYYVRHWMAAETYQVPSPVQATVFIAVCDYLARQDTIAMAQSFADVEFYGQLRNDHSPRIMPGAAFDLDGHSYGILGRSYPETSVAALRGFLAAAAAGWEAAAAGAPVESAAPHRFNRAEFDAALRQALRLCDRLDLLKTSTLARSGWCGMDAPGDEPDRVEALRDRLREASRRLFVSPRDALLDRIIERTYFHPGHKQRAIAAELGISYGTYRRHLAAATQRLVDALWEREPLAAASRRR